MKIQSNNVQFQNNKNSTSFKGAAERKIFEEAVDFLDLQNALKKVTPENKENPVKEYFSEVFKSLAKKFSLLYEECDIDGKTINILKDDELVSIRLLNLKNNYNIEYSENECLDDLTIQGNRTLISFMEKKNRPTIRRLRSQFIQNTKDNSFVESGVMDFFKKNSEDFEDRRLYLNHKKATDPHLN